MKNLLTPMKEKLERIPPLFAFNAAVKCRRMWRQYRIQRKKYEYEASQRGLIYDEDFAATLVKQRLESRGIRPEIKPKGQLKLFWVGTSYAQDSAGIIQGMEKFGEVITFEAKPGYYGQLWPSTSDGRLERDINSKALVNQVNQTLQSGPLDAVIGQMRGRTINPSTLQHLREMGLVVVNISMDDRHTFRGRWDKQSSVGTAALIPSIDLAATTARECCLWYLVEGCPALYLPEASDPNLFRPLSEPKCYDVCFVGANYGIRSKIVKAIEQKGVRVEVYGKGWPNGMIPTEKVPELFARSRIVLGVGTIGYTKDFYALKMRDFDGPMSGSLYLTHHNPDLEELFDIGKEIETYRTPQECVEKVCYFLAHPDQAEAIGRAGRIRAEREHTWEKRFEKLLSTLGFISFSEGRD